MLLTKEEFLICLRARGYDHVLGADISQPEADVQLRQRIKDHLLKLELLEPDLQKPDRFRFSAFAQAIVDTIGKPDVWLELQNLKLGIRRFLYLRDAFYVYVEDAQENVKVDLLPSLPLFIGGYASVLRDLRDVQAGKAEPEDWRLTDLLVQINVCHSEEKLTMEIDRNGITKQSEGKAVSFTRHNQLTCTNAITAWVLDALQRKENDQ